MSSLRKRELRKGDLLMPRIPETDIERIKSDIDLAALVRSKGITLKPHGQDLIGTCPFHNDKTPSFVVTPKKGLWHCLGACQMGGTVIDFVMKTEGVSFRHAAQILLDGKASSLLSGEKIIRQSTTRRLASPFTLDADDQTLLNQVTTIYHETLKQSPKALEYLQHRGLSHPDLLSTFKLGYADRTLGLRLPEKNREAGAAIRERLQRLGIYRQSGHEHLSGSLIIPVLDARANTQNLYGRKILDNLRPGTAYHLYLPGSHRHFFNPASLTQEDLILCESLIDALSFWVYGFRNVTCAYGVEGFTEEMLTMLLQSQVRRVFIAYDRDEAGERGAEKLATKLLSEGLSCFRIHFPLGLDANDFIRKVENPENALRILIHAAQYMDKPSSQATNQAAKEGNLFPGESLDMETGEVLSPMASPSPFSPLAAEPSSSSSATLPPIPYEIRGEDVHIILGDRAYRIRGLHKNQSFDTLRVNVRVTTLTQGLPRLFLDTFDMLSLKGREGFIQHAALELEVKPDILKRDLGRILLKLEELQEEHLTASQKPKQKAPVLSDEDREEALAYLRHPSLWQNICEDLKACGYVGEEINKQVGYLAALSRRLPDPLSLLIQSSSAAGKSSLMDAVLSFVPPEEKVSFSAMTGQALFYMDTDSLKHKVLSIAEEGGMEKAAYALKLLITEKRLSIASTGKDEKSGRHETKVYEVMGPSAVLYTTTKLDVDPELKNRCITLSVNEERSQTRAIHAAQRQARTLEGFHAQRERQEKQRLHHNIQRVLKPLFVLNPYAASLTFLDINHSLRRDQMKYLSLIDAIAYLHQYQRPQKKDSMLGEYIEVTPHDIRIANALAHEVLGTSLDELHPQTRRLLTLIHDFVSEECKKTKTDFSNFRFSRFELRSATLWSDTALKVHLRRLADLEYLAIHRGVGQGFVYECLYQGEGLNGGRFALGLLDAEGLSHHGYDVSRSGQKENRSGSGQAVVKGRSEGGQEGDASFSHNELGAENGFSSLAPVSVVLGNKKSANHNRISHPALASFSV